MFKNIRNLVVTLMAAATIVSVPVAVPALVSAQSDIQKCLAQGSNLNAQDIGANGTCSDTDTNAGTTNINGIIKTVINIFSLIVGVVAVIMIIVGGLRYITSGGESSNVSSAKNTIIYAIIGLVVVALSQFVVQFVLNKVINP
jgi:cytochrome bd-type quinol oxidase subunit 2